MDESHPTMEDLTLDARTAGQFSYHVRMAAAFAAGGDPQRSASEAVLAWSILSTSWPGARTAAEAVGAELVANERAVVSAANREAARRRAHALAMEIESHFVSCGQTAEANLYARVAEHLDATLANLSSAT